MRRSVIVIAFVMSTVALTGCNRGAHDAVNASEHGVFYTDILGNLYAVSGNKMVEIEKESKSTSIGKRINVDQKIPTSDKNIFIKLTGSIKFQDNVRKYWINIKMVKADDTALDENESDKLLTNFGSIGGVTAFNLYFDDVESFKQDDDKRIEVSSFTSYVNPTGSGKIVEKTYKEREVSDIKINQGISTVSVGWQN